MADAHVKSAWIIINKIQVIYILFFLLYLNTNNVDLLFILKIKYRKIIKYSLYFYIDYSRYKKHFSN